MCPVVCEICCGQIHTHTWPNACWPPGFLLAKMINLLSWVLCVSQDCEINNSAANTHHNTQHTSSSLPRHLQGHLNSSSSSFNHSCYHDAFNSTNLSWPDRFRVRRTPCVLSAPCPPLNPHLHPAIFWVPPLPAVHPCRLLNSASLTEEQTNKTPWGNEATSGNRHSERSLAYWCGIDHYWEKGKEKEGKEEIWREELWSDGVDWAVRCCSSEKRWQDKTLISDSGSEITTFWGIVLWVVVWI